MREISNTIKCFINRLLEFATLKSNEPNKLTHCYIRGLNE